MGEAAAQPVPAAVCLGVGAQVVIGEGARRAHRPEGGGREFEFGPVEEHLRHIGCHEEPEVPHAAVGHVHRLLQPEASQQRGEQDERGHLAGELECPGEGDHGSDVVADHDGGPREVERLEQAAQVPGLFCLS